MKKRLIQMFSMIMVLSLLFNVVGTYGLSASAAEAGTLPTNAIVLSQGEWYTKYWTNQNYKLNCYNQIIVPSRGYITFTASKPFDSEGEMCSYDLTLYDVNGNIVWDCSTSPQKDSFSMYYEYRIGLDAGTYYMNIDPSFYVYSDSAPIETQHKYTFTATDSWEIEPNNDLSKATVLTLGKTYTGIYCEESYDTSYNDYFTFYLTKGNKYELTIYNYNALEAGTLIEELYDPSGNEISLYSNGKDSGNSKVWTITAGQTGWYHLLFSNDCNGTGVEYKVKINEAAKISASTTTVKLSNTKYTYNGKTRKPTVMVYDANGKVISSDNYTITYASGRKKVGKYKVTVNFKGEYTGSKSVYFTIVPEKTSVSKVTSGKKSFKVTWKKQKTQTTGYQIQYSTSKNFTSSKTTTKTISDNSKTSRTISSLKKKKTYYVRVRTYKTVNGKKYYSSWSSYKKVKTQ